MQALLSMSTVTTPVMDSTYHGKEGTPQKRYAHLLMLGTCDIDLIGTGLCRYNSVKDLEVKSSWIEVAPECNDRCPYKRQKRRCKDTGEAM